MSEHLLKAIIQLFVIVAKEDEITIDERNKISEFLREYVSANELAKYMKLFDQLSVDYKKTDVEYDKTEITSVTEKINKELTGQQKIVVILDLIELIVADGQITEREKELLYFTAQSFNISPKVVDSLKTFVVVSDKSKLNFENLLIIDQDEESSYNKSKHIYRAHIHGFLVFYRIPSLETYFLKYIGHKNLLLNSAPLRKKHIYIFSQGSAIRGEKFEPLYYSDIVNAFRSSQNEEKISFIAQDISYQFKGGNFGIRNIKIFEHSGNLVGIMGGSGSGKSTLLNVLNGNIKPSSGSVRLNGVDIHFNESAVRGVIGYVPQDDLLMEELTVYENLYYAAKLCFSSYNEEQIDQLVQRVLTSLGLVEIKNLRVGSVLDKSISGGQRKRVNIGLELLREPQVIFLDEPTSGLSSRDSENIMDLLKELTLRGKLVFVVIHQPSSDIFKMFDKLLLLDVGGYQIYYGNPVDALLYFKNIADMIDKEHGECVECGNVNAEQIFNIIEGKIVNEYGRLTDKRKVIPQQWNDIFEKNIAIPKINDEKIPAQKILDLPNRWQQIGIFIKRDVLSKISNTQYLIINLLEAPALAALLAFILKYWPHTGDYSYQQNQNIVIFLFMSIMVSLFMGLTVSAEEILRDQKILKREKFLHLSRLSYLSSKFLILFSLSAVQTLSFVLIGTLILDIKGLTLTYWLVLFSCSAFSNVLGLNISSAFKSAVTVYILIPILLIPQILLSGTVINFDKLNPLITSVKHVPLIGDLMASRWAFEALTVTAYQENPYEKEVYDWDRSMAESEFQTTYLLPKLKAYLDDIHMSYKNNEEQNQKKIKRELAILKNEFSKHLSTVGSEQLPEWNDLEIGKFNEQTYEACNRFMSSLRKMYNNRYAKASDAKESFLKSYEATHNGNDIEGSRKIYENEAITQIVKNTLTEDRMIEVNDEIVQKVYPIYQSPGERNVLDFRMPMFSSEKPFLGMIIPTRVFNVTVIWSMVILLSILLYFDVLRKIVNRG